MFRLTLFAAVLLLSQVLPVAAMTENLSASESWKMLEARTDVYLLDVRTFDEYMQVRLDGARLIPVDQLARRLDEIPRDKAIVVYCAVGSRSSQVARYLARQGFERVYNMYGGIWAWQSRGYPVVTGRP